MKNILKILVGLLKKRTTWLNIIGTILQIVNLLAGQVIPAEYAVMVQGVLNIAMRAITKTAVLEK